MSFVHPGSIGRGYSDKFTAGWYPADLRSGRAAHEGYRGVQYETCQAQVLVSKTNDFL